MLKNFTYISNRKWKETEYIYLFRNTWVKFKYILS